MAVNVALLIWGQLSFILGICGNVFVLYATIFHNAIKLDKMSIWIIKNLAVVDLCNCVFVIIPAISNQYSEGKWIFGSSLCYAYAINLYSPITANAVLINLLSLNKLLRCMYPLRTLSCSRLSKAMASSFTILISSIPMAWIMTALSQKAFNYVLIRINDENITALRICTSYFLDTNTVTTTTRIAVSVATVLTAVPSLSLVITTTMLMIYAMKKTNRPINKTNVLLVILMTASFLLSLLPYTIYAVAHFFPRSISHKLFDKMFECAWSFTFISSWSNPIIYSVMNQNFRNFVKASIRVECRR